MEAKIKAIKLVDRFKDYANDEYHECAQVWKLEENILKNAKQCAIIAAEEIINALPSFDMVDIQEREYWGEVKKQIELF